MGTNKRYGERIDESIEKRRQANAWHPRANAYPDRWICRNGRWGVIYGRVEARDVRRNMLWTTVYVATYLVEGALEEPLGEFATGDGASEALWARFTMKAERPPGSTAPNGGLRTH